ncbi:MAG: hypothetical protein AAFS10_03855, partial [Myxococcota bacterium]
LGQHGRDMLPRERATYDSWRTLMVALLERDHERAAELGRVLARWFPSDPRPHYALGRAWERQARRQDSSHNVSGRAALEGQIRWVRKALGAYQAALAASAEQGRRARWEPTLKVRMARLIWQGRGREPEAATRAERLLSEVDRVALGGLAPPYRITVADIWLHQGKAMDRLRALDMLASVADDPLHASGVIAVLEDYLESLGWSYYATEQDRVRSIVERCAPALGPLGVRRALRYLDLLHELREVAGSHEEATLEHLQKLLRLETEAHGDSITASYYWAAVALVRQSEVPFGDALERALEPARAQLDLLPSRLMREPVALALGALAQRHRPDPKQVRELLAAFGAEVYQVPHVQSSLGLLLPALLAHWQAWPDLQPAMRDAIARFIRLGLRPSYGFAAVAVSLWTLGETELAHAAATRALAQPEQEDEALLMELNGSLAAGALKAGKPHEAVRWLLGASRGRGTGT